MVDCDNTTTLQYIFLLVCIRKQQVNMSATTCKRLCRVHKYLYTLQQRHLLDQSAVRPIKTIYNTQQCRFASKLRAVQPAEPADTSNINFTPPSDPDNPFTLTDAQLAKYVVIYRRYNVIVYGVLYILMIHIILP